MANPVTEGTRALAEQLSGGGGSDGGASAEIRERIATLEANYKTISGQLDTIGAKLDRVGSDVAEAKGELRGKPGHMQIFGIVTFALALVGFAIRYGAELLGTLQ